MIEVLPTLTSVVQQPAIVSTSTAELVFTAQAPPSPSQVPVGKHASGFKLVYIAYIIGASVGVVAVAGFLIWAVKRRQPQMV